MRRSAFWISILMIALFIAGPAAAADKGMTNCKMSFSLKGWSAFYKTANGEGTITCSNGETANVTLKLKGGGLTFGKSEIIDGTGKFSEARSLDELLGKYAAAEAHAGAVKSTQAGVMTKGEISLALAGTGRGVDLGVAFSKLTIKRR